MIKWIIFSLTCFVEWERESFLFVHTNIEEDDAKRNRSGTKGILSWRSNKKGMG